MGKLHFNIASFGDDTYRISILPETDIETRRAYWDWLRDRRIFRDSDDLLQITPDQMFEFKMRWL